MKGLEICRQFWSQFGRPAIEFEVPDFASRIAVGVVGEGSECLGYDDEISLSSGFDPGFCVWLPGEAEFDLNFRIIKAYDRLPETFKGFKRANAYESRTRGVMNISDFYTSFLGTPDVPDNLFWWFSVSPQSLLCASNGSVFLDGTGEFSAVRNKLIKGYPDDVRKKKLAAHVYLMARIADRDFARCLRRRDRAAARLCADEFVHHAVSAAYLVDNKYEPYYKWAFRGLRDLSCAEMIPPLEGILLSGYGEDIAGATDKKMRRVTAILAYGIEKNLAIMRRDRLSQIALAVTNVIKDGNVRKMSIMSGI